MPVPLDLPLDSTPLRAVRGATTVAENTPEAIQQTVAELVTTLVNENQIQANNIVSVLFSVTTDVSAYSPPKAARETLTDWHSVPMLCFQEATIEGLIKQCIRVMIHFRTPLPQSKLKPVYLNGAIALRPDLSQAISQV